ncbi:hypothetical protein ABT072_47445 [Streptomyces sp. NPDC002589]|uniref:hypothetical protein n=1 Tax=Streptomyces sp. NPDC002589 TaxID=3154420 RepID=UPI00331DC007
MTPAPSADRLAEDPIPALIEAAFDSTRRQPTPERLVEIDRLLREEVDRLQAAARAMADHRPVRSRGCYALVNAANGQRRSRVPEPRGFRRGAERQRAGMAHHRAASRYRPYRRPGVRSEQ